MRGIRREIFFVTFILLFLQAGFANVPSYSELFPKTAIRWKKRTVAIEISNSLMKSSNAIRPDSDPKGAVMRSLAVWEKAAAVEFQVIWSERQSANISGRVGDGINLITIAPTAENLQFFNNEESESPARTRVFFNRQGTIVESDIVLNPFQQFSTDGAFGTYDLEATLTHEIGHLLGLEHSPVMGATMYELQPKNGVYGLPGFAQRTLSEDDLVKIRSRYSINDQKADCCSKISGKILLPNNKPAVNAVVWLQESETGRVYSATWTDSEGNYEFDGLEINIYRLFVQGKFVQGKNETIVGEPNYFSDEIGQINTKSDKTDRLDWRILAYQNEIQIDEIGFNGQFSKIPITLNQGKTFQIFLWGQSRQKRDLFYSTGSEDLAFNLENPQGNAQEPDWRFLSLFLQVNDNIKAGDYSILIEDKNGRRKYFVGCLTLEKFNNPWKVYDLK